MLLAENNEKNVKNKRFGIEISRNVSKTLHAKTETATHLSRDETESFLKYVSRPSRDFIHAGQDRDEAETFKNTSRDIRDRGYIPGN